MSIFADIGRVSAGMNKAESDRLALAEAQFLEQERKRIAMEDEETRRRARQELQAGPGLKSFSGAGLQPRVNERASGVASTTQQTTQQQSTQPQTTQQQATQQQAPAQGQPTAGAMPQSAREREAATQAAPAAQGEAQPTQQAGVRQQRVPTDPLQMGAAPFSAYAQRQSDRMREAPQNIPGLVGAQAMGAADLVGSTALGAGGYLQSLLATEGPVESAVRGQFGRQTEPLVAFGQGLGLDIDGNPMLDAYDRFTGRVGDTGQQAAGDAEFMDDEYLARINEGMPPPEPQPATEQPAGEEAAAPQQAGVNEGVSNIEQKAPEAAASSDPQVTKQVIESDVTPSGVKTTKAWERSDFYLANQDAISADIPYMLRQRRIAQFLAESHITRNNFEAAAEVMSGIVGIDQGMIAAQGMLAINQLQEANDPRMLSKMLSYQSGTDTVLVPNLDGTYDVERGGRVTASGVSRDQIAQQAKLSIDSGARQAAAETNMLFQKEAIKARFEMLVQGQKIEGDLLKVLRQGANELEVKTLEAQLKERGFDLISASPDGSGLVIDYQGEIFLWTPPVAGEEPGFFGSLFGAKGTPSYPAGLMTRVGTQQ